MRHWLRIVTLLVICGMIVLSVPGEAAQRGEVAEERAQQVERSERGVEQGVSLLSSAWVAIQVQFGSWFGFTAPGIPEPPESEPVDPVKSSTDPYATPPSLQAILYDNGGEGAIR